MDRTAETSFSSLAREWQIALVLLMVGLLIVACVQLIRHQYTKSAKVLIAEFVLLIIANAIYILRDGVGRFYTGYEGSALPLHSVACAFGLQSFVLYQLLDERKL